MKKAFLTLSLLTVTLTLLASCGQRAKAVDTQATSVEPEQTAAAETGLAPDFELPDLQGNPLKLSSLRGKYVVLDFWGSWCPWCIKGFPALKASYAKHKEKMEVLGVDCHDSEAKWMAAVEEHALPWLQVRCPDDQLQALMQQYHIEGFPTKVVIDPEGKVAHVVVGENPAFYTYLDELFAK